MLGLSNPLTANLIRNSRSFTSTGTLNSAQGLLTAQMVAEVGELCEVHTPHGKVLGEVVGFQGRTAQLMTYTECRGVRPGVAVHGMGRSLNVVAGNPLLGRVINGIGEPIDGKGEIASNQRVSLNGKSPDSIFRQRISRQLVTGVRVIDGFTTLGLGQRVALLAGSGVGKSTLLGEIAKGSDADVNVVALIGERGREVQPFINDCLGKEGLAKSVVVVATADEEPLMRVRAAETALAIASQFRGVGKDVLLLLDSITRIATSQREIGLSLGEPPSLRGYTPSVFKLLSNVLERMGASQVGSITGVITVLVEGNDLDEPICDSVRSITDGHIVLSRDLAQHGHYPAVSVPQSLSRVIRDITDAQHRDATIALRDALATYYEVEDLLRIGAYQTGTSHRIDKAIHLKSAIDDFVRQEVDQHTSFAQTKRWLCELAQQWANTK